MSVANLLSLRHESNVLLRLLLLYRPNGGEVTLSCSSVQKGHSPQEWPF